MIPFYDLVQQLTVILGKLEEMQAALDAGRIDEARRVFHFITELRNSVEEAVFNRRVVNEKLRAEEKNLFDYSQYHLDMRGAHDMMVWMIELLGILGSPRFITSENSMLTFITRDLKGLTDAEFKRDPAYYREMIKDILTPFAKRTYALAGSLTATLGFLEGIQKQKESRMLIILKTSSYRRLRDKSPYGDHKDIIDYVENKIEDYLSRNDFSNRKVTETLAAGTYAGKRHAYLPMPLGNHRIIYDWDGKTRTLTYLAFATHQEI